LLKIIDGFTEVFGKYVGRTPRQLVNALKIAEDTKFGAARQRLADCIAEDGPKIFELNRQKVSLASELKSLRELVESAREETVNKLKSIQEELASALEHINIELNKQKKSLADKVDKYTAFLASDLKSLQVGVDTLEQKERRLTSRIEQLKDEERQEQHVQRSQSQPQFVYLQPVQQERPNLLQKEHRRLAIPVICNNCKRNIPNYLATAKKISKRLEDS
jgi:hypothetical protein